MPSLVVIQVFSTHSVPSARSQYPILDLQGHARRNGILASIVIPRTFLEAANTVYGALPSPTGMECEAVAWQ